MNHLDELKRLYELAVKAKELVLALEILEKIKHAETPEGVANYLIKWNCKPL